jgi:hypothetical protein
MSLTENDLGVIGRIVKPYVKRQDDELREELRALQARLDALEGQIRSMPAVTYAGVHESGKQYLRGELVTYDGSLWHAQKQTTATPGSGADWRLCVKRGRDGKDAR